MMKLFFAALLLFCSTICFAQKDIISNIITQRLTRKPLYAATPALTERSLSIPCAFGKATLNFPDSAVDFNTVEVTAIDLVFTDYPSSNALIQLNTARLQHLFAKYPGLAANHTIEWQVVRQTDGAEKDAALKLFHGFIIYYRAAQNKATAKADLIKLKDMLTPEVTTEAKRNGFVTGDTTELRKQYEIEEYTTVLKLPVAEALRYMHIDIREKITYKNYDSLFVYLKPSTDSATTSSLKDPEDSTVIKVFDRMPWNNMLVVTDVTASMYPYSGQLLLWLKLHEDERRIKQFVFFNDGDDKEDDQKVIGSTGGIYTTSSSVFDVVVALLFKTMSNGNGGNIPENNIEALLAGNVACAGCSDIVMIADNASPVSDMALLKQLNKPIHIILCGVHDAVNTDYLDIARSTGGSIHLAKDDLQQLMTVKEGEQITFHGHQYKITNGKFSLVK